MTDLATVYDHAMAGYNSELVDAQADFARAQASGDISGQVYATQRMADVRVRAQEFDRMARQHVRAMTPQSPGVPSKETIAAMSVDELHASGYGPELLRAAGYFGDIADEDFQRGKAYAAATRNQHTR